MNAGGGAAVVGAGDDPADVSPPEDAAEPGMDDPGEPAPAVASAPPAGASIPVTRTV
jgi:hypothetical protein